MPGRAPRTGANDRVYAFRRQSLSEIDLDLARVVQNGPPMQAQAHACRHRDEDMTVEDEIAGTVARLFNDRSAARQVTEDGSAFDPALWDSLVALGVIAMSVPEDRGGVGLGLAEECAVARTLAEYVAPVPFIATALAGYVLGAGQAGGDLAEKLVSGARIGVGLSVQGPSGIELTVGTDDRASGTLTDLLDGAACDTMIVAHDDLWWSIDLEDAGVERRTTPSLDDTRRLSTVVLTDARVTPIGLVPTANVVARAHCLMAAEAIGVAATALGLTRDYLLQRTQFGQPIGRFQALKQKLAECLIQTEAARSVLWGALRSIRDGNPDHDAARLAKAEATRAATRVVADAVQMHGAIGCTWEHDLHLLMRRAKLLELALGSPDLLLDKLSDAVIRDVAQNPGRRPVDEQDVGFVPSEEDEAFIAPFREWLDVHAPRERISRLRRADLAERRAWQAELADAGWAGLHWSREAGGKEASFTQQVLYYAEMTKRGLPALPGNRGLMLVGPTLIAHGSAEQKALLKPTLRADILWAGGFSERGAGSDLASLRTRGVIDGDELVITGHKIWTSQAQIADWMYALIRTGPYQPKHAGISAVLIPMNAAGVKVQPIRRNNGDYHFNEVFLDEVRVPLSNAIGPINEGWRINRTTMVGEHLTNFLGSQASQAGTVRRVAQAIAEHEARWGPDTGLRHRFARVWADTQVVGLHGLRNVARFTHGDVPGAESSISKLAGQENEKAMFELMVDAMGAEGLHDSVWTRAYLSTRASTIGGGTSEIHRNKLAERVLGMPRDPWADEEVAS